MMETGWAISACAGCSWEATSPAQVVGRAGDGERLLSSVPGHGLGAVTALSRKETPKGSGRSRRRALWISPALCSWLGLVGRCPGTDAGCPKWEAEGLKFSLGGSHLTLFCSPGLPLALQGEYIHLHIGCLPEQLQSTKVSIPTAPSTPGAPGSTQKRGVWSILPGCAVWSIQLPWQ